MNKYLKIFLLVLTLIIVSLVVALWYLQNNNSPITNGAVTYNVAYKKGLHLDVYHPYQSQQSASPTVVFFHGGGWIGGTKEAINLNRFHTVVDQLRLAGYTILSVQYTLAGHKTSPFPNCIEDGQAVFGWIKANAAQYNLDLHQVGVFGESAGAHIAMMLAYDRKFKIANENGMDIQYVVDVYGPSDLQLLTQAPMLDSLNYLLHQLPEKLQSSLEPSQYIFGFDPLEDSVKTAEFIQQYSPLTYVSDQAPATLIVHGTEDALVTIEHSIRLKDKLSALNVVYDTLFIPNTGHIFKDIENLDKQHMETKIIEFIQKQTPPPSILKNQ